MSHGICVPVRHSPKSRRAAAAVEFSIVAPLFFLLLLGSLEFSRMLMVQQVLTNASREGARRAIIEGATAGEVEEIITTYLANASVSGTTTTVAPPDLSTLSLGDAVSVSVAVPYDAISWLPSPWFLGGTTMEATSTMRAERVQ